MTIIRRLASRTRQRGLLLKRGLLTGALAIALSSPMLANPTGPTVKHGQVNINPGVQTQIQQLTDKAIIDWNSFSIDATESVRFLQPSQLSVILNRVTGGDPSIILGELSANGNVFLLNSNGILFAPSSTINVGGLVASTLTLTDQDFLSGQYNFIQDSAAELTSVVNQGTINISDAGYAVLTGSTVINEGTIIARTGNIVLASGEQATLNLDGRDLIHFALEGTVSDGAVLLAPGMLSDSLADTLGIESNQRADKLIRLPDGSVRMVDSSGTTIQAGTASVEGTTNQSGGNILVDAASLTLVTSDSETTASGLGLESSGGDVRVLSDLKDGELDRTIVEAGASLSAAGGVTGDGGFIEVSGDLIDLDANADIALHAPNGSTGLLLIDPTDLIIVDGNFGITPVGGVNQVGDQFIETMLISNPLNFVSDGNIISNVTGTSVTGDTGINTTGTNALTFDTQSASPAPGLSIDLMTDNYSLGGDFSLLAATTLDLGTGTHVVGGNFTLNSNGESRLNTSNITAGTRLTVQSTGGIDLGSAQITTPRTNIEASVSSSIVANGATIDTRGNPAIFTDGGPIDFNAEGTIDFTDVTIRHSAIGPLSITSDGTITIIDSLLESEFQPVGMVNNYLSNANLDSLSDSIVLTNSNFRGNDLTLNAINDITISQAMLQDTEASGTFSAVSDTFQADLVNASDTIDITGNSSVALGSGSASTVMLSGGTLDLISSNISGFSSIELTGVSADLTGSAELTTSRDLGGGPVPAPFISIIVDDSINMDPGATRGLQSARVILETTNNASTDSITAVLDTESISPTAIPTRLSATSGGDIRIIDIASTASGNAKGIALTRTTGAIGTTSVDPHSVRSANGDVSIQSSGDILIGLGTGQPANPTDDGEALVQGAGAGTTVTVRSTGGAIRDRNAGNIGDPFDITNVGGNLILEGAGGVGDFTTVPVSGGRLEFDAENLTVSVTDPLAPINLVSNDDLVFIDVNFTSGVMSIVENGIFSTGATLSNEQSGGTGPNLLMLDQAAPFVAEVIRITSSADLVLDQVTALVDQAVIINTTNNASIRNGTPGGTNPNLRNNNTAAINSGFLVINSDNEIGSETDPLRVTADFLEVDANNAGTGNGIFLAVDPFTGGAPSTINGVDPDFLNNPAATVSLITNPTPGTIEVNGNIIIDGSGDIVIGNQISTGGGVSFNTTGDLTLTNQLSASGNVLIKANSLLGADNRIFNDPSGVGFDLATSLGSQANPFNVGTRNIVLGNNPTLNYFVETDNDEIFVVDQLSVGTDTIAGNQITVFELTNTLGEITISGAVNAGDRVSISTTSAGGGGEVFVQNTVSATNRIDVDSTQSINQGGGGLLEAPVVVLEADTNVGALATDQQIRADRLAVTAGNNAFVQDTTGDLELVNDVSLGGAVGAGNQFRVRVDNGDLTVSTNVQSTEAALVAGTTLNLPAQTTGSDIFVNATVQSTGNLVVLASGGVFGSAAGNLIASNLGLGGALGVGTVAQPIQLNATNLALNPAAGDIQAATAFTTVANVTAVGITVNQGGTAPPPAPPTTPPVTPPIPPNTNQVVVNVVLNPVNQGQADDAEPNVFAQNNVELVDRDLHALLILSELNDIVDLTALPTGWWDDEDFLKRKFRR